MVPYGPRREFSKRFPEGDIEYYIEVMNIVKQPFCTMKCDVSAGRLFLIF